MELLELMKKRYSVRKYSDRAVEDEKLQKILEAGRLAPTAKNNQPQKIYVVKSEEAIRKIREINRCAYDAPVVLIVAIDKEKEWHSDMEEGISSGQQDASIVATHMMLMAANLGLGTVWVDWFDHKKTREEFAAENEEVIMIMPLGYPAEDSVPSANHESRKSLEEMVKVL